MLTISQNLAISWGPVKNVKSNLKFKLNVKRELGQALFQSKDVKAGNNTADSTEILTNQYCIVK